MVTILSTQLLRIKMVLIGEGAVGKTSIARAYLGQTFTSGYKATIGADFYVKRDVFEDAVMGKVNCEFLIWDLAGQVQFTQVRPLYYRGARAAIAVFDVSRKETFYALPNWIHEFWKNAGGVWPLILVGNKADLRGQRECLPQSAGMAYAQKLSQIIGVEVPYIETSALTGYNIRAAFHKLVLTLLAYYRKKFLQKMQK